MPTLMVFGITPLVPWLHIIINKVWRPISKKMWVGIQSTKEERNLFKPSNISYTVLSLSIIANNRCHINIHKIDIEITK